MSAGWLWEMRSAIVARVRDHNPMEMADDLGHRFWRLLSCGQRSTQNLGCHEELLVGSRAVFSRFNGTVGRLISYSDKRAPWVKKEPISYEELSTCWY